MKKIITLIFGLLPFPLFSASVTCGIDEGLIGGNFYDYSINLNTNELQLINAKEEFDFPAPVTVLLDEDFSQKAIWALEKSNGVINYKIDENTNFSLFISRYDYFDGRFSQKVGDHLIITNLYCDFDALDNSKTSF